MSWLTIAISAYFLLAVVFLVDKYLLTVSIPNPKVYAFYVGTLGALALVLAPFVGFYIPEKSQIILSLLSGIFFVYGLFWFYKTLQLFEASRVVPAVGGLTPLFTFGLIYLFSSGQEILSAKGLIAFILLILGSILINLKEEKLINLKSFKFSALTAFLLSLSFVLIKYVYLVQSFWNGFIWRGLGGFLMAVCFFIFFPEIKKEIFKNRTSEGSESKNIRSSLPSLSRAIAKGEEESLLSSPSLRESSVGEEEGKTLFARRGKFPKKTTAIFLTNQTAGAGATILQNWAIALAPLIYLPFVNALQGTQYVFLLIFAVILSFKFPKVLKEEISREIIFQKILAILLMGMGLAILAFL